MSIIMWMVSVILFGSLSFAEDSKEFPSPRPVVLWHGIGQRVGSLHKVKTAIEEEISGIYVLNLQLGKTPEEDLRFGKISNMYEQVAYGCRLIRSDVHLVDGYNAIGFSQGGLLMRAIAQKCPEPPMFNLISMGGPQQGIFGSGNSLINYLLRHTNMPRWKWVQAQHAPLHYWHDPSGNEEKYREDNNFIAELNNENDPINEFYKRNMLRLHNLVLVKFEFDEVVIPHESQWFQFYTPGQAKDILPMKKSRLWLEDRLGLRQLKEEGRMHTENVQGFHLKYDEKWFVETIIRVYLK